MTTPSLSWMRGVASSKDPLEGQTLPTESAARRTAKLIGCEGAHKIGDAWGPCESPEALKILITQGAPAYREWRAKRRGTKVLARTRHVKRVILDAAIEDDKRNRMKRRRRRHRIVLWPKPQPDDWEDLGNHELIGIDGDLPGLTGRRVGSL